MCANVLMTHETVACSYFHHSIMLAGSARFCPRILPLLPSHGSLSKSSAEQDTARHLQLLSIHISRGPWYAQWRFLFNRLSDSIFSSETAVKVARTLS